MNRVYVRIAGILLCLAVMPLLGCDSLPGKPRPEERYVRPSEVASFDVLYGQHCAGCHGDDGTLGAARPLHDPLYLAVVSDDELEHVIGQGVAGTAMSPFVESAGGGLTPAQIAILISGMRERWGDQGRLHTTGLPTYRPGAPGDPARGARVYATFCARCHGADGTGGSDAGAVIDGAFLALVSDQSLRTTVIAGRPDLGKPDYRENVPGRPMTSQEIDDVVAWLTSHREKFPGQPYPSPAASPSPSPLAGNGVERNVSVTRGHGQGAVPGGRG